jgi:6-pyruvoyltetrahydropterin/6-carboxytetrahydropterin synthase
MSYEITQRFYFDAAHTLERAIETESSRRIHGHTYFAEVGVQGDIDASTGMVMDLGAIRRHIERVRASLDHHMLNDIEAIGKPTLENLCRFIAKELSDNGLPISHVRVWRESMGDGCTLRFA